MPLVLVQNEVTVSKAHQRWQDVTGEQYHFPNQYKNRVKPGTTFVYYRGVRRTHHRHATPEYFGCGVVGDVWIDAETVDLPKARRAWFCKIVDYVPFARSVPFKLEGTHLENIRPNLWGVGVREIDNGTYERILELGQIRGTTGTPIGSVKPRLPDIKTVKKTSENHGIDVTIKRPRIETPETSVTLGADSDGYSGNAKIIGDRAEEIVFMQLQGRIQQIGSKLKWVAKDGLKPGWDIQYQDQQGQLVAVEVKGTSGMGFASIELTHREWAAALNLGDRYWIFLVADCLSTSPRIQEIKDPAQMIDDWRAEISPIRWRMEFLAKS